MDRTSGFGPDDIGSNPVRPIIFPEDYRWLLKKSMILFLINNFYRKQHLSYANAKYALMDLVEDKGLESVVLSDKIKHKILKVINSENKAKEMQYLFDDKYLFEMLKPYLLPYQKYEISEYPKNPKQIK